MEFIEMYKGVKIFKSKRWCNWWCNGCGFWKLANVKNDNK